MFAVFMTTLSNDRPELQGICSTREAADEWIAGRKPPPGTCTAEQLKRCMREEYEVEEFELDEFKMEAPMRFRGRFCCATYVDPNQRPVVWWDVEGDPSEAARIHWNNENPARDHVTAYGSTYTEAVERATVTSAEMRSGIIKRPSFVLTAAAQTIRGTGRQR